MKIEIKRINKELRLPKYETDGAVAFDFLARETTEINSKEIKLIPGNVIVKIPKGYALIIAARSSTARKKGLMLANGIGTIDQDFHGENDEIMISVYNFTKEKVIVEKGERIAQGMFVRVDRAEWIETDKMKDVSRGSFGSTKGYK
jgi:dUTP pyrophosphatase